MRIKQSLCKAALSLQSSVLQNFDGLFCVHHVFQPIMGALPMLPGRALAGAAPRNTATAQANATTATNGRTLIIALASVVVLALSS